MQLSLWFNSVALSSKLFEAYSNCFLVYCSPRLIPLVFSAEQIILEILIKQYDNL